MAIPIIAAWLSSFFYSVLLCFDWLIVLRKIILMGSRYPRSNLSNRLRYTTLGFHSFGRRGNKMLPKEQEKSQISDLTPITYTIPLSQLMYTMRMKKKVEDISQF